MKVEIYLTEEILENKKSEPILTFFLDENNGVSYKARSPKYGDFGKITMSEKSMVNYQTGNRYDVKTNPEAWIEALSTRPSGMLYTYRTGK